MPKRNYPKTLTDRIKAAKARKKKRRAKGKALGLKGGGGEYQREMAKAWELCSFWVRLNHKRTLGPNCPFDCSKPIEHAFHFFPRTILPLKFEPENLIGSCPGHNWNEKEMRGRTDFYKRHFIRLRGQDTWDRLKAAADAYLAAPGSFKFIVPDLIAVQEKFKRKISEQIGVYG